ncbi:hypothetical protein QCA50_007955 [Cerrena zonata]|uniref:Uncharacterized protein n=1 Tax=Cerrena zonata TaxID=2478898 RepID=A0AAW0GC84_9APHY
MLQPEHLNTRFRLLLPSTVSNKTCSFTDVKKCNLVPLHGPQTLQEILTFFAPPHRELPTQTELEVQVCEMALVADNVNQTLNM